MDEHYDKQIELIMPEKLGALAAVPEVLDDDDFDSRAKRMAAIAKSRAAVEPQKESLAVQLPIWAEPERIAPNSILRSALFGCARQRTFVKDQLLASWPDTELRFSGETLNQFDETVWMQLVHMFRQQGEPPDFKVRFNAKPFMRALGKAGQSGKHVHQLRMALIRLRGGTVLLSHKGVEYGGGILNDFTLDEDRGYFVATLNPKYLLLLGTGHTRLDWETRKALPTGIATWLHCYILSHQATEAHPHRIGLEQLRTLSGMSSAPKEFRRHLKRTMERLEARGIVTRWGITPNKALEVVRPKNLIAPLAARARQRPKRLSPKA